MTIYNPKFKTSDQVVISFGSDIPIEDPFIYSFYHIPKCGGMDFYASLSEVLNHAKTRRNQNTFSVREDDNLQEIDEMARLLQDPRFPKSGPNGMLAIIASHLGYEAFGKLFPDPSQTRSITFLREPYSRAISAYCYASMRKAIPVSKDNFEAYIAHKKNQNVICKSLFPSISTSDEILKRLHGFYICSTIDRQNICLQQILYQHGLYNVLRDRINVTIEEYRLDEALKDTALIDYFYSLNGMDYDVWKVFKDNPIEPDFNHIQNISSTTLVMKEDQRQDHLKYDVNIVPTDSILKDEYKTGLHDFSVLELTSINSKEIYV